MEIYTKLSTLDPSVRVADFLSGKNWEVRKMEERYDQFMRGKGNVESNKSKGVHIDKVAVGHPKINQSGDNQNTSSSSTGSSS